MSEPAAPATLSLPRSTAVLGLSLFACAFFPLTPAGRTFVQVAIDAFGQGLVAGVVMVVGFGSPFLFGLAIAAGVWTRDDATAARLVRGPVTMMHSQLLLMAWMIWRHGDAVASLPLLLFAVVSALYVVQHSASERAAGRSASFRWYVRSGAVLIVTVAAWLWLQRTVGLEMGRAVIMAGMCALSLLLRARRQG
ncbi:hypothetical protein [Paraliomyxa miuraensis]|uniref:hypothetical protein n=1 Tax=Paraliomyxa miuraensis TaxID=376150 RepID=UPI00224E2F93|nr:hypothetical protein [Paraliomyxa miuraensis]MCX4247338.1 hypothetical protein [Paraliomyxa miuraensis]